MGDSIVINTPEEEEDDMNKKGTCSNCERNDITVVGDLCHTCYNAAKGKSGEARDIALRETADRIKNGKLRGNWRRAVQEKETTGKTEGCNGLENGLKSGSIKLELDKYPKIKEAIEREAESEIRTIEEQVLYILKKHVEKVAC